MQKAEVSEVDIISDRFNQMRLLRLYIKFDMFQCRVNGSLCPEHKNRHLTDREAQWNVKH